MASRAVQNDRAKADPLRVVDVRVLDAETVNRVIAQVEVSPQADHLAYREAEVDALWSLADMAAKAGQTGAPALVELLWEAHEHIGDGNQGEAITALVRLRDTLADVSWVVS